MFLAQVTLPPDFPLSVGPESVRTPCLLVNLMGGQALGFPGQGHFHCQLDALGVTYHWGTSALSNLFLRSISSSLIAA